MAKRKKLSKSEEIRRYMVTNKGASTEDIAKALKVKPALIYNVKANMKKKLGHSSRRARSMANGSDTGATEQVIEAAKLINVCGGIEQARSALKAVEQVASVLQ